MTSVNAARVRAANDRPINPDGRYVLYWCQMYRRLTANHALDHALAQAAALGKPLVVYEGLKLNYPWANARIHTFMLEGMRDSVRVAAEVGATYWPFVETPADAGRGLVKKLGDAACLLVTDDYPQYIIPAHIRAVAAKTRIAVHAVDGNSLVPLATLGPAAAAAAPLRLRIHKLFKAAWAERASDTPDFGGVPRLTGQPPFALWQPPADVRAYVKSLPVDQSVPAVPDVEGGSVAGRQVLSDFVTTKLPRYSDDRSKPDDPAKNSASRLSPYLHYGHIGIQQITAAVLGTVKDWSPKLLNITTRNKDDFFCRDANVNGYLDEAITWRDVGYHWHFVRRAQLDAAGPPAEAKSWQAADEAMPSFNYHSFDFAPLPAAGTLGETLPDWAKASLAKHTPDPRPHTYTAAQFELAQTHDALWNAAQHELVATGRIHNYLRMLWAKKVLEWSRTPEEAYRVLEHLNNKYALDGRDPNSYTGILWTFGLFDRPWPPERTIFGVIRYMTSDSTAKKFKLQGYLDWIKRLPTVAEVRAGTNPAARPGGLF